MEVVVYSSNSCTFCLHQFDFLIKNGVKFIINEKEDYFNEFKELGGTSSPFTIKKENGKIVSKIRGFDVNRLSQELLN